MLSLIEIDFEDICREIESRELDVSWFWHYLKLCKNALINLCTFIITAFMHIVTDIPLL